MNYRNITLYIKAFLLLLLVQSSTLFAQDVEFKASAPKGVVKGEQFRLSYTLNKQGKDLRLPSDMEGFEILFGPSESSSYSTQIINGKSTSQSSFTYTYILTASEEGTFTIGPASINVDGSNYKSNSLQINVLPPDKDSDKAKPGSSSSSSVEIKDTDAFIRAIVSKNRIYEQEGFMVTFKLYTTLDVVNFGRIEFPEFEGFLVEELDVASNQQLQLEHYNGRNYYTAVLRKTLLFPQRSGKMTIPRGRIEMVFSVPSGKKISSFFGMQEVNVDVKKPMITNPVTINVNALPSGKSSSFTGAVGSSFSFKPSISTDKIEANEPITIKLEISGTGNQKLIQNPEIDFPTNFEVYDPTIKNDLTPSSNGFTGTRTIEYLAIPRYEGEYSIPPIEFSYFDLNSNSYKTFKSPSYSLNVLKGDPSKATASTYINRQEVRVEQDIRYIKTGEPKFIRTDNYFVGSWSYWLWYLIPFVLLCVFFLLYRKQMKLNANVALMRNKRAKKVARRRLKEAEKHLKKGDESNFYNEVLQALWGYFSDKLSIPGANLTRNNIGAELTAYGVDQDLIDRFIHILDTCEFARYAPVESSAEMNHIYQEATDAIEKMENILKIKQ